MCPYAPCVYSKLLEYLLYIFHTNFEFQSELRHWADFSYLTSEEKISTENRSTCMWVTPTSVLKAMSFSNMASDLKLAQVLAMSVIGFLSAPLFYDRLLICIRDFIYWVQNWPETVGILFILSYIMLLSIPKVVRVNQMVMWIQNVGLIHCQAVRQIGNLLLLKSFQQKGGLVEFRQN